MPRPTPATPAKRGAGGGAANPFQKLAENHASRAGSVSPSQRTPKSSPRPEPRDPHDAFLLPRTLEGTHHRKLRVLLQEFLKEATAWEEEHTLDGIRWASEMAQAWDDVATATLAIPGTDALAGEQRRARLVPVLMQLEEASAQLTKMCTRLRKHANKMELLAEQGRVLYLEAASGSRAEAITHEPMWGTWTMDRFVRALASLSMQYSVSTVHLAGLVDQLQQGHPSAPDESAASAPRLTSTKKTSATDTPQTTTASSPHRQALEAFVRLPYLHASGISSNAPSFGADAELVTGVSRHFLEHICETEVRSFA